MMKYTVKQLAELAGISNRTLHYYDEIGLLRPTTYGANGYRYYGEEAIIRLQQILFYRELNISLDQIKKILDRPDFNLLHALEGHKLALQERVERMNRLIMTVNQTILHLKGEINMSTKDYYSGFDEGQQQAYAREAEKRWGAVAANSQRRWNSYSREEKNEILAQMHTISASIAENMDKSPESSEVQYWIERWHQHINQYFYDCSLETFQALGHMYTEDTAFQATYESIRPGMPAFMDKAMTFYCLTKAEQGE